MGSTFVEEQFVTSALSLLPRSLPCWLFTFANAKSIANATCTERVSPGYLNRSYPYPFALNEFPGLSSYYISNPENVIEGLMLCKLLGVKKAKTDSFFHIYGNNFSWSDCLSFGG